MTQENVTQPNPESQQERWMKYGANVALVSLVVIALAVGVIYLLEKKATKRFDTTASGLYSLKPQTMGVITANNQPITIISLYTKAKPPKTGEQAANDEAAATAAAVDKVGMVTDLLAEYAARGKNITVENIDPNTNPTKVSDLIKDVEKQYSSEVTKYQTFADSLKAKDDAIAKVATEQAAIAKEVRPKIKEENLGEFMRLVFDTVDEVPGDIKEYEKAYQKAMKLPVPDYKGVSDSVADRMKGLSGKLGQILGAFDSIKTAKDLPPELIAYVNSATPAFTQLKKQADDLVTEAKSLGDLKLDTLRDALRQTNAILVRGDKEWRVIPYEKVWKTNPADARARGDAIPKPLFAGEQMITTAIMSLNQPTKPKVCFVRVGGPPLTDASTNGRFSSLADRLRDYNFDVSEKDLSGTWAMQAMQQQQEPAPEPTDEQIADAVWVVDGIPSRQSQMMGGPPANTADKLAEHMAKGFHYVDGKKVSGGSAFVLFYPQGDSLSAALSSWGINARVDAVAVHQFVKTEVESGGDMIEAAQHTPYIFAITDWGDHQITHSMQSLMTVLVAAVPLEIKHTEGVISTPLITVPTAPTAQLSWGETDFSSVQAEPKFDKDTDIAGPLYAAAAAEKSGQRLVCLSSEEAATNQVVDMPDIQLFRKSGAFVPQFPGSGEMFMNSMFWLSHQETMIAISPAAMNVSRIGPMSAGMLKFWDWGVLMVGLPGLVLLAGAGVYFSRRD